MRTRTPDRHRGARNRARQSAARELAAAMGITYQQALRRLAGGRAWSAQIELTFVVDLSLEDTERTSAQVAQDTLTDIIARGAELLAGRGELRVIDLNLLAASRFSCEQGCGRETPADCGQPDCPHASEAYQPDLVLGFHADGLDEARQTLEALLDILDGGFDDAVTFNCAERHQPAPVAAFNTRLTWLYRDANNYKTQMSVVLEGEPARETMAALRAGLDRGVFFIPSQVGLPDLQVDLQAYDSEQSRREYERHPDLDPDHPWHEIEAAVGQQVELTTDPADPDNAAVEPPVALRFDEFARRIHDTTWDSTTPVR